MPSVEASDLDDVINYPREALHIELKDWFDPRSVEGIAKLVKACFALYNRDGGLLLVGFDNKSGEPTQCTLEPDAIKGFHADTIQAVLSRYASRPFPIDLLWRSVGHQNHPIIRIPAGVRLPVIVRGDLASQNGKKILQVGQLYFRTLNSNLTVSSSTIKWNDYEDLMDTLFRNRETDIGAFLQRNITSDVIDTLLNALGAARRAKEATERPFEEEERLLEEGQTRYQRAITRRNIETVAHGALEIAAVISTSIAGLTPTIENLWKILEANPNYTGWPWWINSLGFHNEDSRPQVLDDSWESLIYQLGTGWGSHLDFWIIYAPNRFYHRRALQDDVGGSSDKRESLKYFDPILATLRVTEALVVPLHFARSLGFTSEGQTIGYAFRWTRMAGRELASWGSPERRIPSGRRSVQNTVTTMVRIPATANEGALMPVVKQVMDGVTSIFSGFTLSQNVIDDLVKRLLERRL